MLLSIAMIVKDEEKNIERCLQALKGLDGKIKYETVIVDTGSTDNTINIAKKYTEKVYQHKWTNDFAEMRNLSISYCKGDWILVIDADEVLENPNELGVFFQEKCKLYNSGIVKLNNYTSDDMYIIGGLIRLFKNDGDFYYIGRVHEQPMCKKPTCITNITFNHYGYCRNDYELMQYKYERNIKLLLKDLEEGKEKIYNLFQLCQTYSMAKKTNEALKCIDKAYKIVRNNKNLRDDVRYLYIYRQLAVELYGIGNYERAIEVCKQAILLSNKFIDFYYILAQSNKFLKNYKEAEKYFYEYFKLYESNKQEYIDYITVTDFSTSKYDDVIMDRIHNLYELKDYKRVIKLYEGLEEKKKDKLNQIILYSFIREKEYKKICEFYKDKEIEDKDIESIKTVIERIIADSLNDNFNDILNSFKGLNKILDIYLNYMLFNKEIDIKTVEVNYRKYYNWKAEMLKVEIKKDISVLDEIKKLDNLDREQYLNYICGDYECIKSLEKYDKDNFLCLDIGDQSFQIIIEKKLMFLSSIDGEKLEDLIYRSFINNISLMRKVYNFNVINSENSEFILSRYDYFWYKMNHIINKYSNDKLYYIKNLKELVKEMPEFKKIFEVFQGKISENLISNEMQKEKEKILASIEELVKNNMLDEAENILRELDNLFIYDVEIKNSLGVILFLKGQLDNGLINLALSNTLKQNNFDTIYNLACVLEAKQSLDEAKYYYKRAYDLCKNEELKLQINKIINILDKQ
ncbi:glycosyltransferase family 2 protein [Clostridium saccharobutylicum]|uniref:SPBc2 prophage-derived glycosyltransferase SunS n=1 Tax=Clostridium saccharobutylicum TaxID=169679 RepID=A0A1S8NIJ3_CLOSA|nr:glycosyltransferase family 2 protein [Clostridium saccharobutylicum]OOM16267.1 SPBc2 prophage-derived glycosyltransferase SunS [Clostridium saccharobutylicum]